MQQVNTVGTFSSGGGVYATDGSGGKHTKDPRLRRCGWAAVHITGQGLDLKLQGAAWGPLPGKQTVGRAELWAIIFLLHSAPGDLTVYLDCKSVYKRWAANNRNIKKSTSMGDLWQLFWGALDQRDTELNLIWHPSHKTAEQAVASSIPPSAYAANNAADKLAAMGAKQHQLDDTLVEQVKELDQLAAQVQDRLTTINLKVAGSLGPRAKAHPKAKAPPTLKWRKLISNTTHRLSRRGRQWACSQCHKAVTGTKLGAWLRKGPCPGRPAAPIPVPMARGRGQVMSSHSLATARRLDPSHRLRHHRGVFICKVCGAWGSSNPKALCGPCAKAPSVSGKASLSRWRRGIHPRGKAFPWPEDSIPIATQDELLIV